MTRWAMVADLERCVGCQTCTAACRHANATSPAVQWRKVLDIEAGTYPNVSRIFVPVGCQHCADPPCMHVCPTTATRQRADGIVTVDYDLCIGCAYCEVACPYQARFLVHEHHFAYDAATQNEIERFDPARLGVAQKCTFCSDRVDFGTENGLTPGIDPRATPACVNSCIADALHFGDVDDPNSNVSRLLREQRNFRMHAELGTDPGFYYLYGKANDPEKKSDALAAGSILPSGQLRTRGVEPSRQQHWDWKAAEGAMTRRGLNDHEKSDVDYGRPIAHRIATMDIGQTVVVRDQAIVAVEAMEGTDAVIRRAGELANKKNLTVVKVSKPNQDMRFDVPVIGVETIHVAKEAQLRAIAVEAGKTLFLERDAVVNLANAASISILGR